MLTVVLAWIACVAPSLAYLLATNLVSSPSLSHSCLFILGDNSFHKGKQQKDKTVVDLFFTATILARKSRVSLDTDAGFVLFRFYLGLVHVTGKNLRRQMEPKPNKFYR